MAGTIGLSLQQQIDINTGGLLIGGRLFFYQAGTVGTPQNAFQDLALTKPYPNPITLLADARIPPFYLADGLIRVRLEDSVGNKQFDWDNVQVVGPSGGGGGGGTTVDPTALFQTGWPLWIPVATTLAGWVRMNLRTIGSSTSGATERANADTQNLFTYIWNSYADAVAPVSGGRGASATADWSANKTIGLPDMRGRGPQGLDDMGSTAANLLTGALFTLGGPTTAAAAGGEALHTLTVGETPIITPSINYTPQAITGSSISTLPTVVNTNGAPVFTGNAVTPTWTASNSYAPGTLSSTSNFTPGVTTAGLQTGGGTSVAASGSAAVQISVPSYTPTGTVGPITPSGTVTLPTYILTGGAISTTISSGAVSANAFGGGANHNNMQPFRLGTWFMKL